MKGMRITTEKETYSVQELVGEGTFGAVYRVATSKSPTKIHAMKCEVKKGKVQESKLETEITILKLLGGRKHFTELIDVGDQGTFRFFIMELVGKNLSDLKRARSNSIHILDFGISRKYGQGETESVKESKFKNMFLCGVKSKRVLLKVIKYLDKLSCNDLADYKLLSGIIHE
ncbi:hypothetical protein OSTOST_04395, partial [Ostertagia ostertagi]